MCQTTPLHISCDFHLKGNLATAWIVQHKCPGQAFLPQTHSAKIALKSKREFYMAEVVFARICAGALPLSELAEQAQGNQQFHEG
jgi:hypothetical protein